MISSFKGILDNVKMAAVNIANQELKLDKKAENHKGYMSFNL